MAIEEVPVDAFSIRQVIVPPRKWLLRTMVINPNKTVIREWISQAIIGLK